MGNACPRPTVMDIRGALGVLTWYLCKGSSSPVYHEEKVHLRHREGKRLAGDTGKGTGQDLTGLCPETMLVSTTFLLI